VADEAGGGSERGELEEEGVEEVGECGVAARESRGERTHTGVETAELICDVVATAAAMWGRSCEETERESGW
jgi:hypothetical protein